jgi:hypothetical protein
LTDQAEGKAEEWRDQRHPSAHEHRGRADGRRDKEAEDLRHGSDKQPSEPQNNSAADRLADRHCQAANAGGHGGERFDHLEGQGIEGGGRAGDDRLDLIEDAEDLAVKVRDASAQAAELPHRIEAVRHPRAVLLHALGERADAALHAT